MGQYINDIIGKLLNLIKLISKKNVFYWNVGPFLKVLTHTFIYITYTIHDIMIFWTKSSKLECSLSTPSVNCLNWLSKFPINVVIDRKCNLIFRRKKIFPFFCSIYRKGDENVDGHLKIIVDCLFIIYIRFMIPWLQAFSVMISKSGGERSEKQDQPSYFSLHSPSLFGYHDWNPRVTPLNSTELIKFVIDKCFYRNDYFNIST